MKCKNIAGLRKFIKNGFYVSGISVCAIALALVFSVSASAGSINANEQSVISAASGTFEYQGNLYKAKSSYLGQLRSKLSADDTDLSASDAQQAIAKMYASVGEGVEKGYLELISTGETAAPASEDPGKGESGKDNGDGGNDAGDASQTPAPTPETNSPGLDKGGKMIENESKADQIQEQLGLQGDLKDSESELGYAEPVEITATTAGIKIDIDITNATQKMKFNSMTGFDTILKALCQKIVLPLAIIFIILFVIGIFFIRLFMKKYSNDENANKKRVSAAIMTYIGAVLIILSFIVNFKVFSDDAIVDSAAGSNYYELAYIDTKEVIDGLCKNAGFKEDILDNVFSQEEFHTDGRLAIESYLKRQKSTGFLNIDAKVYSKISHFLADNGYNFNSDTAFAAASFSGLVQAVYLNGLNFTYASGIDQIKDIINYIFIFILLVGIVLFVIGIISLFAHERFYHRAVFTIALSLFTGAVAGLIPSIVFFCLGYGIHPGFTPECYDKFFNFYLANGAKGFIGLNIIILVLSLVLAFTAKFLREKKLHNRFFRY
ncbi:MAG: hypothetical protein VZR00_03955 [Lachnospiraceae bacterium]|jgi:heme/copper-type cytochrome/quinol oxidase subunit 2|nr:hypothetical protein [Lachnospiraceae bacterium]